MRDEGGRRARDVWRGGRTGTQFVVIRHYGFGYLFWNSVGIK